MATGQTLAVFHPFAYEPPASNPAACGARNAHPFLAFDGATDEEAVWTDWLDADVYDGGGLTLDLYVMLATATSGTFRFQAAIERMDLSSLDLDADSFASFKSNGASAPGTSGQIVKVTITFTSGAEMDSVVAGEPFRLKVRRDADGTSGTDDITTDAQLVLAVLKET